MKTVGDLFGCWDSIPEMADDVGVNHWRASKWKQREIIPTKYWPATISALRRKGKNVSAEDLLHMHGHRPASRSARP